MKKSMILSFVVLFAVCLPGALRAQSLDNGFNPGANDYVLSLAVQQADGKILVGGNFTTLAGQARSRLGRLNANGSLDASFTNGAGNTVYSLALQADGKILVGGSFTTLAGQTRNYLGRLNANGSLDTTFTSTSGANAVVDDLAVQADGKILVGGSFTRLAEQTRNYLGRLNADGSLDASFTNGAGNTVYSLALQADGKILVGGSFTTLAGQARSRLGRLNANGSLDTTFNSGADGLVYSLALQADGKILVGGSFTTLAGQARSRLGRLNADGSLDTTFTNGADNVVWSLALQADGKILVGGSFTTLAGQARSRLGRLNANGSLDTTFTNGANSVVRPLALQTDGKILVGGFFTNLAGQARSRLGRLNVDVPPSEVLLTTVASGNGSVSPTTGLQPIGSYVSITATPAQYYRFVHWTGDASGTNNPLSLLMDGPKTVTAWFEERVVSHCTPEWWLASYGLTNDVNAAATNDVDGDGKVGWQEYWANTDPTNRSSVFKMQVVNKTNAAGYVIGWTGGRTGPVYFISFSTNYGMDGWSILASNLSWSAAGYTDTVHGTSSPIWYRVGVRSPCDVEFLPEL